MKIPGQRIPCVLAVLMMLTGVTFAHDDDNTGISRLRLLPETPGEMTSLICLATAENHKPMLTLDEARHGLIPVTESSLKTYIPDQVLLVLRGKRQILSDLFLAVQSGGTPATQTYAALMDSLDSMQRQCYLSPARDREAIGRILEAESFPLEEDNIVMYDNELIAIYLNQEHTIAISKKEKRKAALGLQQLGLEKGSTHLWLGTNLSSDNLTRLPQEAFDHYLQSTDSTTSCGPENHNDSPHASLRCGSAGKKIEGREGVHLTYEDPHHAASEAVLWTTVGMTLLCILLLPFAIFLPFL